MSSMRSGILRLFGALAVLAVGAGLGSATAVAEPEELPVFGGLMTFPNIQAADGPEEFSWEVQVGEEQELVQIDDQHAVVYWQGSGDPPHVAVSITATPAHDAAGSNVPTSIAISDGNVLTLTVHHRAGNPAAGGAPFHYPVIGGAGWEGGFKTYPIEMPPAVGISLPPAPRCLVPRLTGRSLPAVREMLKGRGCKLGKVRGKRSPTAKVAKQFRESGSELPAGTRVAVKLGG